MPRPIGGDVRDDALVHCLRTHLEFAWRVLPRRSRLGRKSATARVQSIVERSFIERTSGAAFPELRAAHADHGSEHARIRDCRFGLPRKARAILSVVARRNEYGNPDYGRF